MKPPGWRALVFGGLLPIIAFSVIEEVYGIVAGLIAGMLFGFGEIIWEWRTQRRVDPMTWGGNALVIGLGGISLVTQEGVWFKLQPAILEAFFAVALIGSWMMGKPLLIEMSRKQGTFPQGASPEFDQIFQDGFSGMTLRLGVFFVIQSALAVWAALHWSTIAWATLKGVGLTVSLIAYLVVETLLLRYRIAKWKESKATGNPPHPGPRPNSI